MVLGGGRVMTVVLVVLAVCTGCVLAQATPPNASSNSTESGGNALYPDPSYCAPPDCVEKESPVRFVPAAPLDGGPAPGAEEEDGTAEAAGAPQYEPQSAAPGLVAAPRPGDPGGPAVVGATTIPLSGANNSGAPQFSNASEEAPLHAPDEEAMNPAEIQPLNFSSGNNNSNNATEETTNKMDVELAPTVKPTQTTAQTKKLAPGCAPGETPNTDSGCEHDDTSQVHHEHHQSDDGDHTETGQHADGENKKETVKEPSDSPEDRMVSLGESVMQENPGEHTDWEQLSHEELATQVSEREKTAKTRLVSNELARKTLRKEQAETAMTESIASQVQKSLPGAPEPASSPQAPLAEEANEMHEKTDAAATAWKDEQRNARDVSDEKYEKADAANKKENSFAFPDSEASHPPDATHTDSAANSTTSTEYQSSPDNANAAEQNTALAAEYEQKRLDEERSRGESVPGMRAYHNAYPDTAETPTAANITVSDVEYPDAERKVKATQAQYDQDTAAPAERKTAPSKIMQHIPGRDVVAVATPAEDRGQAPQYEVNRGFEPIPPEYHIANRDHSSPTVTANTDREVEASVQRLDASSDFSEY